MRNHRAFTIVEVLVAISLVVGLGTALFSFAWGLLERRERIIERCDADGVAEAMLEELENALASSFVADGTGQAGVAGGAGRITVRGRGVDSGTTPSIGDVVRVEFSFDSGSAALQGSRGDGGMVAVGRVGRVAFRFWNGTEWLDTFDSAAAKRLPSMVEVRVWLQRVNMETDEAEGEDVDLADVWGRPDRERIIVVPDAGRAEVAE